MCLLLTIYGLFLIKKEKQKFLQNKHFLLTGILNFIVLILLIYNFYIVTKLPNIKLNITINEKLFLNLSNNDDHKLEIKNFIKYFKNRSTIVFFPRNIKSPFSQAHIKELNWLYRSANGKYSIVIVSPKDYLELKKFAKENNILIPIFEDKNRIISNYFGVLYSDEKNDINILPTLMIINEEKKVEYIYKASRYNNLLSSVKLNNLLINE